MLCLTNFSPLWFIFFLVTNSLPTETRCHMSHWNSFLLHLYIFFNFPFPYKMCEEKCVVCKIIYGWGAWWNTWQSSSYSERGSWLVYIPFELLKVWTCFGVQMLKAKPLGLSVQSGHYLQYTGLGCTLLVHNCVDAILIFFNCYCFVWALIDFGRIPGPLLKYNMSII